MVASVATAGFFPLDLGFLVSSGFLGIFVINLGFFHLVVHQSGRIAVYCV